MGKRKKRRFSPGSQKGNGVKTHFRFGEKGFDVAPYSLGVGGFHRVSAAGSLMQPRWGAKKLPRVGF